VPLFGLALVSKNIAINIAATTKTIAVIDKIFFIFLTPLFVFSL
jgi:hypothetical protein